MKRTMLVLVGAVATLTLVLTGCGKSEDSGSDTKAAGLTITDAWAREVQGQGVAYMTITGGESADALLKASVPATVAKEAQLHETTAGMEAPTTTAGDAPETSTAPSTTMGGMSMSMKPIDKIAIPANGTVQLKPGGFHIMLIDVPTPFTAGDTIPVTLTFEKAGTKTVDATVRAL